MTSLSEFQAGLVVGTVESVDADGIDVVLLHDAPHGTALNARIMSRFPRVNSYVVIPSEVGPIVGLISGIRIDRASLRDVGEQEDLVGTVAPRRRVTVVPLGVLLQGEAGAYEVRRGVIVFPTVGDPVLLPTFHQLSALTRTLNPSGVISIGRSPIAGGAEVWVDVDRLFTRHLAILGNTGSGKSCSVTSLLRLAVQQAGDQLGQDPDLDLRIVILDTNGEYSESFEDLPVPVRRFAVEGSPDEGVSPLRVPAWLWTSLEWTAFSLARPGAQVPYVKRALVDLRSRAVIGDPHLRRLATILGKLQVQVRQRVVQGPSTEFGPRQDEGLLIETIGTSASALIEGAPQEVVDLLERLDERTAMIANSSRTSGTRGPVWSTVALPEWEALQELLDEVLLLASQEDGSARPIHEDDPIPFSVDELPEVIELSAMEETTGSAYAWVAPLVFRLRGLLADRRIRAVAVDDPEVTETLDQWLDSVLGRGQISVVDLSLVPTAALHVVVAVLARLIFDAHERFRRQFGRSLPTILVAEEAHVYLGRRRGVASEEAAVLPSELCAISFEQIAREGRKFGLSLVVTSQRPSELSETVLSQCNTFLVHRIVNDVDQALIRRLVPDALGDLLSELPSLPTRVGMLLGWAADIPTVVEMHDLDVNYRPQSDDPPLFGVWTGDKPGSTGWTAVSDLWSAGGQAPSEVSEPDDAESQSRDSTLE